MAIGKMRSNKTKLCISSCSSMKIFNVVNAIGIIQSETIKSLLPVKAFNLIGIKGHYVNSWPFYILI